MARGAPWWHAVGAAGQLLASGALLLVKYPIRRRNTFLRSNVGQLDGLSGQQREEGHRRPWRPVKEGAGFGFQDLAVC